MKLRKNQMYLFVTGIIVLVMLVNKSVYLLRCDFAEGTITSNAPRYISGKYGQTAIYKTIRFTVNNEEVVFYSEQNSKHHVGQKVTVVYLKSNSSQARIFSLSEYWIPGFTRGLFAFIILSGIIYAFMHPNHILIIRLKRPFRISIRHKKWSNSYDRSQTAPDLYHPESEKSKIPKNTRR